MQLGAGGMATRLGQRVAWARDETEAGDVRLGANSDARTGVDEQRGTSSVGSAWLQEQR